MQKKPLIVIAGPTAVGKSALSVKLAAELGGEIISADSMQVYRGMDIGTAKITEKEMNGVPHHLINVLDPKEPFNITLFQKMAKEAIRGIYERNKIPVLTGGTGFYIQSVIYDIDFDDSSENSCIRDELNKEMQELGPEKMHEMLEKADPASALAIHPNNRRKVIRALEFYRMTGQRISEHNEEQHKNLSPYRMKFYVLSMEREILYRKIGMRVDRMMEEGLLEEVKRLRDSGCTSDMISMQGLGYKEIFAYLEGRSTYEDAVEKIKAETRHYAKRQLTWFKREPEAVWILMQDYGYDRDKILEKIMPECRELTETEEGDLK